ncbi:MAG: GNAT family N-acetyltransferase [Polyangia bacterium]
MQTQAQPSQRALPVEVRALVPADLDSVVQLDAALSRKARPRYFQQRLDSAIKHPAHHLQVAAQVDGRLIGYLLARIGGGEFGGSQPTVTLETISVDPTQRHHGAGAAMHARSSIWLVTKRRAPCTPRWTGWTLLLGFLAHKGWTLSGRQVLQRTASPLAALDDQDQTEENVDAIRALRPTDVDAVLRLDRQRTGQDRGDCCGARRWMRCMTAPWWCRWLRSKTEPSWDSAWRRSITGPGGIQPRAPQLEAISIQPGFEHKGYARALVGQLLTNLGAILVDDVTTTVDWDHFQLLGFFRHLGFGPSQRLALSLRL